MCRPLSPDTSLDALLCQACRDGTDADVTELLARGANPNAFAGALRSAPLATAAAHGRVDAAKLLLAAGADPHISSAVSGVPLAWAIAFRPTAEMMTLLLDAGTDVNLPDSTGRTCLHIAAAHGTEAATRLVLDAGGRTDIAGTAGAWIGRRPIDVVRVDGWG